MDAIATIQTPERQGLNELPYGAYDVGSLVPKQGRLIDMLLDGSWRTMTQQEGTMGSVDTPAPAQNVNTPTKIPTWAFIAGAAFILLLIGGK